MSSVPFRRKFIGYLSPFLPSLAALLSSVDGCIGEIDCGDGVAWGVEERSGVLGGGDAGSDSVSVRARGTPFSVGRNLKEPKSGTALKCCTSSKVSKLVSVDGFFSCLSTPLNAAGS